MHPYVYKKHHKPHQLRALTITILILIMILCQSVNSQTCNVAVKKIRIFSQFTKGFLRIERNNRVVASKPNDDSSNEYLYKVTIDQHYMLIYHIQSGKFICWNKTYKKLVARRNPTNLTYCKLEDRVSKMRNGTSIRYTTKDDKGREIEIRFNKLGAFAKPNVITKCAKKHRSPYKTKEFLELNPLEIDKSSRQMEAYRFLSEHCANPDFLPRDEKKCVSRLPEFCAEMRSLRDKGHNITSEIMDLCKNEWKKSN